MRPLLLVLCLGLLIAGGLIYAGSRTKPDLETASGNISESGQVQHDRLSRKQVSFNKDVHDQTKSALSEREHLQREMEMIVQEQVAMPDDPSLLADFEEASAQEERQLAELSIQLGPTQLQDLRTLRANPKVRHADGTLAEGYIRKEVCERGSCKGVIVNAMSNQEIWSAGQWAEGYQETGVGKEVVRVK